MIVLGIESTCDETAAALVQDGTKILSHSIASSVDIHEQYGGVFPELACRRHLEAILPVIQKTLQEGGVSPQEIDLIAVAKGPGLVGALLIGMQVAKGLAISWQKPFLGVNHVEAHLYAAMMGAPPPWPLPALGCVLSGGHTLLVQIENIGQCHLLSTTHDDALGETFDKVALSLGCPYPGGPHVEQLARLGDAKRYPFKAGRVKASPLAFSFSGIKTSVRYAVQDKILTAQDRSDLAASFQEAVFQDVIHKIQGALQQLPSQAVYFGGGVCNNQRLRSLCKETFSLPVFWPPKDLSSDNAIMIAGLGFQKFHRHPIGDPLDLEVSPRLPIA